VNKSAPQDTAGVIVLPPLIYVLAIIIGIALERIWPTASCLPVAGKPAGVGLVAAGILILALCLRQFRSAGTPINPYKPTEKLITSGLYRYSRNPVYVADFILQAGIGLWLNNLWIVLMIPSVLAAVYFGVVLREERYLAAKFGQEYLDYKARVRRWF
jgi:protein-S-isoprenylcysteine O-methyltransferase Ste14